MQSENPEAPKTPKAGIIQPQQQKKKHKKRLLLNKLNQLILLLSRRRQVETKDGLRENNNVIVTPRCTKTQKSHKAAARSTRPKKQITRTNIFYCG